MRVDLIMLSSDKYCIISDLNNNNSKVFHSNQYFSFLWTIICANGGGVIFFDPLSMLVFPFFLSFMALPLACSTTKHMVPSMNNACYPTINITKLFDIFYAIFFFTPKIIQRQVKKYLWICQWERVWWWWWWYYNSWGGLSVCGKQY